MLKQWITTRLRDPKGLLTAALVLIVLFVGYGAYEYMSLRGSYTLLEGESTVLRQDLSASQEENERLSQELRDKLYIIESFEGQIRSLSGVVGNLQKLSQTDEELLRKYSKISFLNENYVPARLGEIDEQYSFHANGTPLLIHADTVPYLERLLRAAKSDSIDLLVSSAFRSFDTQASLKSGYTVIYGAGTANQFSADQGFSEHQLGTTVDFATKESGAAAKKFETDPAFKWLNDHAHRYGFVLSYPKGNSYYIFEPWHWRFVGVELATRLKQENKHFYDLDQRDIDEYLIKLFD